MDLYMFDFHVFLTRPRSVSNYKNNQAQDVFHLYKLKLDPFRPRYLNQSRICGKGVGLSLFPSDSLSFESYEQFVRKSKKNRKMTVFLAIFGLNLAMFLTSQPYEFNEIAHKGP